MEFYAQNTESGGSPIWSLRGKRSPVQSIKSGNSKRLEVTLTPFIEDLSARGVIDALAVYTKAGDLLYDFGSEDYASFFESDSEMFEQLSKKEQLIFINIFIRCTYIFEGEGWFGLNQRSNGWTPAACLEALYKSSE